MEEKGFTLLIGVSCLIATSLLISLIAVGWNSSHRELFFCSNPLRGMGLMMLVLALLSIAYWPVCKHKLLQEICVSFV